MAEQSKDGSHAAGASATFEAAITKRGRPVLSKEERKRVAQENNENQTKWAAARDREVAEALMARAKEREASLPKGGHA